MLRRVGLFQYRGCVPQLTTPAIPTTAPTPLDRENLILVVHAPKQGPAVSYQGVEPENHPSLTVQCQQADQIPRTRISGEQAQSVGEGQYSWVKVSDGG